MRLFRNKNHFKNISGRDILFGGKICAPGQTFDVGEDDPDSHAAAVASFYAGKVEPTLIPDVAGCEAVKTFSLRNDAGELVEIRCGEIIELGREHIIDLIRKRCIVPLDAEICWCPYRKRARMEAEPWQIPNEPKKRPWASNWKDKTAHPVPGLKKK